MPVRRYDVIEVALIIGFLAATLAAAASFAIKDCRARGACEAKGGRVVEITERCTYTSTTHHSSDGRTSWTTYDKHCPWRCEVPAEKP